jgi:3-hydroxybutyryl-CoA dehydrogenase
MTRSIEPPELIVKLTALEAWLGLGHAMGPFELMDVTTLSLCLQAQEIKLEPYGERFRPRPLLKQRVRAGFAGGVGKRGWRSS